MRRCTLLIDERDQCVYYPSSGAGGQVLAMNGIPVIEVKIYIHINKSLQILVLIIHKVCTFHFESVLNSGASVWEGEGSTKNLAILSTFLFFRKKTP